MILVDKFDDSDLFAHVAMIKENRCKRYQNKLCNAVICNAASLVPQGLIYIYVYT